jgi:protease I
MPKDIGGKRVAILATDGFEQDELIEPKRALEQAGAETIVVSPSGGTIRGWRDGDWGDEIGVDRTLDGARVEEFDALVIPGGVINPDRLRREESVVRFVREFFESGQPIAAICHGPWVLIEADVVRGRRITSYESIRTDCVNAGADWVDSEVVVDQGLVTSRKPEDIPAFNHKLIEEIAEGRHERREVRHRAHADVRRDGPASMR